MENINITQNPIAPEPKKGFLATLRENLGILNWVFTIIIAVSVFFLSQRDLQTAQAATVTDTANRVKNLESRIETTKTMRDKQLDDLKNSMLSKEVFEAYHKNDVERMARIESMLEKMSLTPRYYNPQP